MRTVRIAPLVEGDGEVQAVPLLIRRIIFEIDPSIATHISPAFRHPSGSIRRTGGLERAIQTLAALSRDHAILVLIDSDDDCPKDLGPELVRRAHAARSDVHVSVVLAHREYETWFLAAAESLAGKRNLMPGIAAPATPENIRDAKGWPTHHLPDAMRYSPTQDQAALSHLLDLKLARVRSRSFRKLWKEIETMVQIMSNP